jgi:hypothetical protein
MTEICCCIPKSFIRRRTVAPAFEVLGLDDTAKARARIRGDRTNRTDFPFFDKQLLAVPTVSRQRPKLVDSHHADDRRDRSAVAGAFRNGLALGRLGDKTWKTMFEWELRNVI